MTLPVHGNSISLSQIQTEFGGSNPISLSEYYAGGSYVPSGTSGEHGAIPSSGTTSLDKFHGSSNLPQSNFVWAGVETGWAYGSGDERFYDVAVMSNGTILAGGIKPRTSSAGIVWKFNSLGAVQFQNKHTFAAAPCYIYAIHQKVDANYFYVGIYSVNWSVGAVLARLYVSDGSLYWARKAYNNSQFVSTHPKSIAEDSSGNVYFRVVYPTYGEIIKYNNAGTVQWRRRVSSVSDTFGSGSLAIDSSNNVYASFSDNGTYRSSYLLKWNSSGTLQWQRRMYKSSQHVQAVGIAIASDDSIYAASFTYNEGVTIAKYNSSGTLQWQRNIASWSQSFGNVCCVGTDVYAVNGLNSGGAYVGTSAKWNSSGTLQWQRTHTPPTYSYDEALVFNGTSGLLNKVYIAGMYETYEFIDETMTSAAILHSIATDGTITGTDTVSSSIWESEGNTFIHASSSYTESAGTASEAAGTLTEAAGGLLDATVSVTGTTTTFSDYQLVNL